MFALSGKGFFITFDNGWTASVQWGEGNYCGNRYEGKDGDDCKNAEIAAWYGQREVWHSFGGDDVKGWCKPAEVLAFLNQVSSFDEPEVL